METLRGHLLSPIFYLLLKQKYGYPAGELAAPVAGLGIELSATPAGVLNLCLTQHEATHSSLAASSPD